MAVGIKLGGKSIALKKIQTHRCDFILHDGLQVQSLFDFYNIMLEYKKKT